MNYKTERQKESLIFLSNAISRANADGVSPLDILQSIDDKFVQLFGVTIKDVLFIKEQK